MKWKTVLTFLMLAPIPNIVLAECPQYTIDLPKISGLEIRAAVIRNASTGVYTYNYTVKNGANSTGCLWSLDVDITKPPNTITLSEEGLTDAKGVDKSVLHSQEFSPPSMVPVGFPSHPKVEGVQAWIGGVTIKGRAIWGPAFNRSLLEPSEVLNDIILTSYGLPTIRDYVINPDYNPPPVDEETPGMLDQIRKIRSEIALKGKIIGPTAPPANFVALDFLMRIEDLKHQAFELGWITNEGVIKSLDVRLDQAKKNLQAGNPKAVSNVLNAFLKEVSAQGCESYENCAPGKHLKPEAWALLKFNTEYLLAKL
jgi:hypothetical protein